MKASILDLRYKMKEVLNALDRNETVTILYHGKEKGEIIPKRSKNKGKMSEHPFFGVMKDQTGDMEEQMEKLRGARYSDDI